MAAHQRHLKSPSRQTISAAEVRVSFKRDAMVRLKTDPSAGAQSNMHPRFHPNFWMMSAAKYKMTLKTTTNINELKSPIPNISSARTAPIKPNMQVLPTDFDKLIVLSPNSRLLPLLH